MRLSKLGYDLYKNNEMINPVTGSAGKSEVTGFRNELVASGQNSDAIRHVFMTAGGGLSGTPFSQVISGAMNAYDGYQANVLRRAESAAELAGNIAGHDAGKAMRSFALGHTSDSASLRQTLMDRLCQ
jgi:hypothetical protein